MISDLEDVVNSTESYQSEATTSTEAEHFSSLFVHVTVSSSFPFNIFLLFSLTFISGFIHTQIQLFEVSFFICKVNFFHIVR